MKRTFFYSVLCVVAMSCGNSPKELAEMHELKKAIADKHKLEDVSVSLKYVDNGAHVSVTLTNSPVKDSSDQYKEALADSIGKLCVANIHSVKLTGGDLELATKHFYVVAYSSSTTSYDMHIGNSPAGNSSAEANAD